MGLSPTEMDFLPPDASYRCFIMSMLPVIKFRFDLFGVRCIFPLNVQTNVTVRKLLLSCTTLFFSVISTLAQETPGNDSLRKAQLLAYHDVTVQQQQRLYNGKEHTGYSPRIKGHAYYLTREWQYGSVLYDGVHYKDVAILYDSYKDQVVVKHPNDQFIVSLVSPKVNSFTIAGRRFIPLEADQPQNIKGGFYELLTDGTVQVLAKRWKTMREYINVTMEYEFMEHNQYIIKKDGTYNIIRSEGKLLDVLGDKRAEVKQYLKKNGIRYKKTPEEAIVKAVEYYQSLSK
jgi:hypothetical protein